MSDVYSEPFDKGYAELWCLNGEHAYALGRCIHCDRKDHTVEYKPVTD